MTQSIDFLTIVVLHTVYCTLNNVIRFRYSLVSTIIYL